MEESRETVETDEMMVRRVESSKKMERVMVKNGRETRRIKGKK
jgi:hypothetical protein